MKVTEEYGTEEKLEESPAKVDAKTWLEKIKKREKVFTDGWWKSAEDAVTLYQYEKQDPQNPYNILYSNTEVLKPSLYSATPKPDVRGRFVENPVSPLTKLVENFLIVFSDPANPGEESLDQAMGESVTSALTAGLGFIRLRLYPDRPVPICPEAGHYKGLIWPEGRKWSKLPWIAFRHEMTKEEIFSQFEIPAEKQKNLKADDDSSDSNNEKDDKKPLGFVVYELWDKNTKKITYLCEDWEDLVLDSEDDPMKIQGFYPTPGLLLMTTKAGRLIPTPLYEYYREQAAELNKITARLRAVLSAIKVRGAYNSMLGEEMATILSDSSMENKLVPAQESAMLAQNGGFERQIWLLPIEQLITVATELYNARVQIKQVIYEITGLSDIIRGSSIASETATAQNLKNKWGSIRLRDMQKSVASYVRDLYRLCTDTAAKNIPPKTWKQITQAPIPTDAEKKVAVSQLQHMQASAQTQAFIAQSQGQPPQPPQPPNPALVQAAQSPITIESLLVQIKSDANRTFTINVQSDSTVDLDTATDKAEVAEFMTAMGQLLAGLQPLAALGPSGLEIGKQIMISVCSRFKFGLSILDSLKALQPPPPPPNPGPTPEQQQKEQDLQAQQEQLQTIMGQIKDAKADLEKKMVQFEGDKKEAFAQMETKQVALDSQQKVIQANQTAFKAQNDASTAASQVDYHKRKADLQSEGAKVKAAGDAQKQVQQQALPAVQGMTDAIAKMSDAMTQIQELISKSSQKPIRVEKQGNTFVPIYGENQ